MAYTTFTKEQVDLMQQNPYTLSASSTQLRFTLAFKEKFMSLLLAGKSLRGIFE